MDTECPIGCETYTATNPRIECPYCNADACLKCQKAYLLGASLDPHCMGCRRAWTPDVVASLFPEAFRKGELRKKVIQLLAEREKAYFPEAMETAIRNDLARRLNESLSKKRKIVLKIKRHMKLSDKLTHELVDEYNRVCGETEDLEKEQTHLRHGQPHEVVRIRTTTVRPCPVHGCEGYLSTAWKCASCNIHVCSKCEEPKGREEHACNPDTVATVELKRKDTKPCPKCGVCVSKTSGCDQMWCINCKTPFSWRTLQVESGLIHNPHYFEWLHRTGADVARTLPDNMCDDGWVWQSPRVLFGQHYKPTNQDVTTASNILRCMQEINHNNHNNNYAYNPQLYRELREKRIMGRITDKEWCTRLSALETVRKRKQTLHQIDIAMQAAASDLIRRLHARLSTWTETLEQLNALRNITNEQRMREWSDASAKFYHIWDDTWAMVPIKKQVSGLQQ